MWEWLATLPLTWQIALPIIIMIFIVTISIWGNAAIKWGKRSIGFGKQKDRSCARCRNLVMILTTKYKFERDMLHDSVLRDQMNYAEQKIHELDLNLSSSYRQMIINARDKENPLDITREQKEYLLYQEALSNSLILVLKELRRSFKENGFDDMSAVEYTQYCKEKSNTLISISREYIMSRYPFEGMIISLQDRFDSMDINHIETKVFSIFDRAREVVSDFKKKTEILDKKFEEDLNNVEI